MHPTSSCTEPLPTHLLAATPPTATARFDLYAGIHKALRLALTRTLTRVGSTDPADPRERAGTLDQVERLLALCELHLKDENEFVHPALERARPGTSERIAGEHVHHQQAIDDLRELAVCADAARAPARSGAWDRLYRGLALFVADNLQHMHFEETVHNPALWAAYTDAELLDIERAIVASIPPAAMAEALHWFMPALSAPERAGMLGGMRGEMPPEAFEGVMQIAQRTLEPAALSRLHRDLGLPAVQPEAALA